MPCDLPGVLHEAFDESAAGGHYSHGPPDGHRTADEQQACDEERDRGAGQVADRHGGN